MSEAPFSLLADRWLPVVRASGSSAWIRPAEMTGGLQDDPIIAFGWSRADFDAAAREFMIGLLATACGQRAADPDGWQDWWEQPPSSDDLDAALLPITDAFLLDGVGPRFMQDLDELEGKPVGVGGLLIDAPGANTLKNNFDLFVKRGGIDRLSRAAAAMALFALQAFAPAGGAGHRTSLRGGGPMTTLVIAAERDAQTPLSLWHQLWLNVFWDETWPERAGSSLPVFPWCAPTRLSGGKGNTTPEHVHPGQAYWGMPRRIRLLFEPNDQRSPCDLTGLVDEVVVRGYLTRPAGHNYEGWSRGHPLTPYYRARPGDAEWLPLHPRPGHLGYRDWVGLVVSDGDEPTRMPAQILPIAGERLRDLHWPGQARLLATGFDMDKMKARGFVESAMPVLLAAEPLREKVERAIRKLVGAARLAEGLVSFEVGRAQAGRELPPADKGSRGLARERFWSETEGDFLALAASFEDRFAAPGTDEETERRALEKVGLDWLAILRRRALAIFDELVPLDAIEQRPMVRLVQARRGLTLAFAGYGKAGGALFDALGLARPAGGKRKQGRKAA